MTDQLTTTPATAFDETLATLAQSVDEQLLISQDRCVDGLLDLYNSATCELIRDLVVDAIDDIRHLSSVRADALRQQLNHLAAAAAVESAFTS